MNSMSFSTQATRDPQLKVIVYKCWGIHDVIQKIEADLDVKGHRKTAFFKSQNLKMPKETRLMLTDDMIHELQNENIIFQKEYTRQIYDTKSFLATGSYLKDSSVTYIKIKKETPGVRGDSDE